VRNVRVLPWSLVLLAACDPGSGKEQLRPGLTHFRLGDVDVNAYETEPVIPEDRYIPGVVVAPEDYDLGTERRAPSGWLTDLAQMLELDDPAPLEKHASYEYYSGRGDLIKDGELKYDQVAQGAIGDCYMVAALSAVLFADSENIIRDGLVRQIEDADGNVTSFLVRVYDAWGEPQDIELDADLVRSSSGKPTYARSMANDSFEEEFGISIVEKAYAEWMGGYPEIGDGGWPGDVLQALTGATASYRPIGRYSTSSLRRTLTDALDAGKPVVVTTFGKDDDVDYEGTGVYAWHAYTVIGAREDAVRLRNPWGRVEPVGDDTDDGQFWMPWETFRELYNGLTIGGGFGPDTTAPSRIDDLELHVMAGDHAVLHFTATGDDARTGQAYSYDVRISEQPITVESFEAAEQVAVADPRAPGTAEEISVPLENYPEIAYVAVRVVDEVGNTSPMSENIAIQVNDAPVALVAPSLWSFDGDVSDWTATGQFHTTGWRTPEGSGAAWWFNEEESRTYSTGVAVHGELYSPNIDLSSTIGEIGLWFEHQLDLGGVNAVRLEIQLDGGAWQPAWSATEDTNGWALEEVVVGDASERLRLRFIFDGAELPSGTPAGWGIDNVWVFEN